MPIKKQEYEIDYTGLLTEHLVCHFGLIAANAGPGTSVDSPTRELLSPEQVVSRSYDIATHLTVLLTTMGHLKIKEKEDGTQD